ncbi:MAG: MFS transporter, partial [Anaerolineales bacterium]
MTTAQSNKPSMFAVFRNRDFSFIWTGQLVSTIGNALTSLAASILVYRVTDSALSVGLMLMATAAPSLLVGLVAGVFVDRFDRKKLMVWADLLRALLVFLIPLLVPHGVAYLYVIVMLTSVVGQFFDPAHSSVLPEIASDEELAAANSFIAISAFGSTAVGFAASGLIASRFPIEWAFYLDAITFIISALCILMVNIRPLEVEGRVTVGMIGDNLREGLTYLTDSPVLRSLLIVSVPVLLGFGLWNSLLLPFAERALNATEFEYGLQEGLTSVGFVLASLLMARMGDRLREGAWISISYLGMGAVGILYARTASIPLAIALVTMVGFFNAPSMISNRLLVQRNTERGIRGRVSSGFSVSKNIALLIGMAAAGLADVLDVRTMMLISALIISSAGVISTFLPGLRESGDEWKHAASVLQVSTSIPSLELGRAATVTDLNLLLEQIPILEQLVDIEKTQLIDGARVINVPEKGLILQRGGLSEEAFFILDGKVVAGVPVDGHGYRPLSIMLPGDFFGEIAALMGIERTADVVAEEESVLLEVPAENLK